MGDSMTKEELLNRIFNEVIDFSKKYDCNFILSIFPYSIIVENNSIKLLDELTYEEKVLESICKNNPLKISSLELCEYLINILEKYQDDYQSITLKNVTPYLSGEVMTYSTYCPLKYKLILKDMTLDRNESGAWIIDSNEEIKRVEVQSPAKHDKLNSKKKEVLLFFSGGRDSMLAACRLIRQGYYVSMISFDNGSEVGIDNIGETAKRIINRYGSNCCRYLGSYYMGDIKKSLQYYFDNTSFKKIYEELGSIDFNQVQCMACRSAMYMAGIILCKIYGIDIIAEGARKCQLFAIEQPKMIEEYRILLERYKIKLELPVYELESDWQRRLELQDNGFLPKTLESVCTIGLPMSGPLSEDDINMHTYAYQKKILPSINKGLDILLK